MEPDHHRQQVKHPLDAADRDLKQGQTKRDVQWLQCPAVASSPFQEKDDREDRQWAMIRPISA